MAREARPNERNETLNLKTRVMTIGSMLLIASVPLAASAENDFGRSGPYLKGGVAAAFDGSSFLGEVDTGVGFAFVGGYRMSKWLALEGQYSWLGNTDVSFLGSTSTAKRWDATANLRASLSGRFQPYAVIGVGYSSFESSTFGTTRGGFASRWGGGLDAYITNHLALYIDATYMWLTGDVENLNYVTLGAGAMLRF